MKKKILSLILALAMIIPLVPVFELPVYAATSGTTGDCTWTLNGTVLTISGNGAMEDYTLTTTNTGAFITTVPWGQSITSVVIKDGVTYIGKMAFYECKALSAVEIPNSVTSIGEDAFCNCNKLASIAIPDSVTAIGSSAFDGTAWYDAQEDGIVYAGKVAYGAKGTCPPVVQLKEGTVGLADYAFSMCETLTDITIPEGVTRIPDFAFRFCSSLQSVTIPDSVTTIGVYAFDACSSLTSITIPDSVTTIGYAAFEQCRALATINLGHRIALIDDDAFYYCSALTEVWYNGTISDRQLIEIKSDNEKLTNATWHYVDGDCDTACNECGANREPIADHTYDNDEDSICNVCGQVRHILKTSASSAEIAQGESFAVSVLFSNNINTQGFGLDFTAAYDHALFEWVSGDWAEDIKSKSQLAITYPGSYAAFVGENSLAVSGEIFSFVLKPIDTLDCSKTYEIKTAPSKLLEALVVGTTISAKHTYDNACDTDCNVCGETREVTHDFSVRANNEEAHWMKCSVCSLLDETTLEAHIHDNACDVDCNVCGQYRTVPHSYTVQDKNTETHWMKCSICGTIDESTREAHGYDNACDTTCDDCGYVRTITHDYSVQDKDKDEHWMKCSVCGVVDETTRENHGYDNNCDTTCDECGQVRTITHDYSVQDKNTETHWMKCSICGTIDESTREAHGYDNACDTDCNVCGETREVTHDFSVRANDEEAHWMKCSVCSLLDETTLEAHIHDNACDVDCNVCGQYRTVSHNYTVQDKDTETHWMKCSVCGSVDESTREEHIYENSDDLVCDECGFVFTSLKLVTSVTPSEFGQDELITVSVSLSETVNTQGFGLNFSEAYDHEAFEWVSGNWSKEIKNNSLMTSVKTGAQAVFAAQTPIDISGEIFTFELRPIGATSCKQSYDVEVTTSKQLPSRSEGTAISLKHTYDHACDADCNICGDTRAITHDFTVQDKDETSHWMKCSICYAMDETTRESHIHDNACDAECNVCKAIRQVPDHVHSNACDTTCNECGAERQVPDHVYDDANDLICNECGFERPPYTPGDVDGNGEVDLDDAIYLLYHVNFKDAYPVNQPVDFDGNGKEDLDDAIYLLYHVNFKDAYPLH